MAHSVAVMELARGVHQAFVRAPKDGRGRTAIDVSRRPLHPQVRETIRGAARSLS